MMLHMAMAEIINLMVSVFGVVDLFAQCIGIYGGCVHDFQERTSHKWQWQQTLWLLVPYQNPYVVLLSGGLS